MGVNFYRQTNLVESLFTIIINKDSTHLWGSTVFAEHQDFLRTAKKVVEMYSYFGKEMITFLSHFSQWYALAPSSKSPLTNCSKESTKLWWLRMSTFRAMNGASREYLMQKDKLACHDEEKQHFSDRSPRDFVLKIYKYLKYAT